MMHAFQVLLCARAAASINTILLHIACGNGALPAVMVQNRVSYLETSEHKHLDGIRVQLSNSLLFKCVRDHSLTHMLHLAEA
jgi:phosphopantetheine adenylyltransferase